MGDIASSFEYGLNAAAKEYDGKNKYIRITDIDDNTHGFLTDNLTSPDIHLTSADNYKLTEGDILFARTGASVGKSYIYRNSDGLVYYAGFLIRARIKEEYDAEFVFQNTLTDRYNKYIAMTSQRSGQPGVNAQEYAEFEINVPQKEEQTKIGTYFHNLDHLITLHQYKLYMGVYRKGTILTYFWEQRKLSDFAIKAVDNRGKTPPLSEEGTHPLIEVAALGNGHPDYSKVEKYLDDYSFRHNLRDYIKEGDILFSTVGSIGLVSLMDSHENAAIAQNIVAFRAKQGYLPKFLYSLFSTAENQERANRIVMGAVQPSIKVSQLVDVEYYVTNNIKEQRMLGEMFYNLDNLITLHQRKCDNLKIIKKSMLDNLFPKIGEKVPKWRFKGFNNDWEQRELSNVAERITRKNQDLECTLPLTISAQYGLIDQNEFFDKRIASKDVRGYYLIRKGEFAYNKSISADAPWGAIKRLDRYESGVLSTLYIVFRILDEKQVDSDYLVTYYETDLWHKDVKVIAAEGARNHGLLNIAAADFFKTTLICPQDIEEQQLIGCYFKSLDHLITLHQSEVERLKKAKQFFLDKMFI